MKPAPPVTRIVLTSSALFIWSRCRTRGSRSLYLTQAVASSTARDLIGRPSKRRPINSPLLIVEDLLERRALGEGLHHRVVVRWIHEHVRRPQRVHEVKSFRIRVGI